MFEFPDLRYIARLLQFLGVLLGLGSLSYWRERPAMASLFTFSAIAAWIVGRRLHRWARQNDPMIRRPDTPSGDGPTAAATWLVGETGRTLCALRPAGLVEVAGARIDAYSDSGFVPEGCSVRVVGVRAGTIVVRVIDEPE